ncbi:acyl-CoA thioesterase [Halotalea alkalilenta]|nr:thioesterase family protein [Halotalea alkalilenta]
MPHVTPIIVRGYHLDVYRHVNNARYLEFIEEARWALFDEVDALAWMERHGVGFVIVHIDIDFNSSARLGDRLEVRTELSDAITEGARSARMTQSIHCGERQVAEARVVYVCIDLTSERALPIEGELLQTLESWRQRYVSA